VRLLKACLLRFQQLGCRGVLWQPRCETNGMLLRILDISEKVSFEHFFFQDLGPMEEDYSRIMDSAHPITAKIFQEEGR
jgi:hypothetical protein